MNELNGLIMSIKEQVSEYGGNSKVSIIYSALDGSYIDHYINGIQEDYIPNILQQRSMGVKLHTSTLGELYKEALKEGMRRTRN